jgi:hypothetical protein
MGLLMPESRLKTLVASPGEAELQQRDPGSFRDPSGFVFRADGVLYRQVNPCYRDDYDHLVSSGLAARLMDRGLLIQHEEVPAPSRAAVGYKWIRPEQVPFISYPYEWSFSQLRDAALLTLRVQSAALKHGMSLKDASAYNVQFGRGKPVLIDTLSFERYVEGRPWVAYRQFCQHFLAPLALMAYQDVRLGQLFRVFIDGVPLDLAAGLLPLRTRAKPSLAIHLHLHARLQKSYSGRAAITGRASVNAARLTSLLQTLATTIGDLRWKPAGTEWADYYSDTNYSNSALDEKARLVSQVLDRLQPATVWDLGANTGRFSRLASARGIAVVAFDLDAAAVERNYSECVSAGDVHLLPLVLDLSNPSPNLGWASSERLSLQSRGPADLVLALALIHHLAIGNNVPFWKIAEFLSGLCANLLIEFVPKSDSQVQRLLASRPDVFDDYTQHAFEHAFESHFSIVTTAPIAGTSRILYHMRSRQRSQ